MFKKRIVTLMSVCACLMATHGAGVVNAATLAMSDSEMAGDRICLLHLYDWNESASGVVTVTQSDPFYYGGWTATVGAGETPGYLTVEGGITMYAVPQPLRVDYALRTVTLEATDEPFATLSGSKTTVVDGVTTTVDSVQHFYIVNEAWVKQTGDLEDVVGEILPDGTIHIEPGFAYYIETTRTTTITAGSHSRTFTDETQDVSRVFRDTWLMRPNGKHEYVSQATGEQHSSDVYIYQSGDTVHVVNLYGYGAPEAIMILHGDGTMSYPGQMLRDIPDGVSVGGAGVWYNATADGAAATAGNEGNATAAAITWGLTTPWDNVRTWSGWDQNRLYYTDGSEFIMPTPPEPEFELGDVDHNYSVDIEDVTMLIAQVLGLSPSGFYEDVANCDGEGVIDVSDITALIARVLNGHW